MDIFRKQNMILFGGEILRGVDYLTDFWAAISELNNEQQMTIIFDWKLSETPVIFFMALSKIEKETEVRFNIEIEIDMNPETFYEGFDLNLIERSTV